MKTETKKIIGIAAATLFAGLFFGWLFFGGSENRSLDEHQHDNEMVGETIWTCSMHPQIRQNEPGNCPICGMELIPLEEDGNAELDPMAISMSQTAMQIANVGTEIVGKSKPVKLLRLNGKIQADERSVYSQSSHIPGRIEKLMVNFTGEYVNKGQVIASIYSPDLVNAQEELFEARKIVETQPLLFNSAKEKLKNWKLSDNQIAQILESGTVKEELPILADISGYVTEKMVNLGDYVNKGMAIYEIANLSSVWILFDVYESDMAWIKKGDQVSFTVQSLPGETFNGKISYIDPVIDPMSRVAKARIEVNNKGLKLKPEMFVSGTVEAKLPIKSDAIVVPKTAVMWTGKRSVVYVKNTSSKGVNFMMREVTLGPSLGNGFVVNEGLQEGEEIAINGTFSIDAAAQLAGKPSMMAPEGGGGASMPGMPGMKMGDGSAMKGAQKSTEKFIEGKAYDFRDHVPAVFRKQLDAVIEAYINLKDGMVQADEKATAKYSSSLLDVIQQVDGSLLKGDAKAFWEEKKSFLMQHARLCKEASTIAGKRENFIYLSQPLIKLVEAFGPGDEKLYVDYCPMANNNKGAFWLSETKEIRNPFMAESMRSCGEVKQEIPSIK